VFRRHEVSTADSWSWGPRHCLPSPTAHFSCIFRF
jgi:hypothetical protein